MRRLIKVKYGKKTIHLDTENKVTKARNTKERKPYENDMSRRGDSCTEEWLDTNEVMI